MQQLSLPALLIAPQMSKAIMPNSAYEGGTTFTSSSIVWYFFSTFLRPKSPDRSFWWRTSGAVLAASLHQAKYSWIDQCSILYFYYDFITPRLGPRPPESGQPPTWRSFMTDDFSPLEFSWKWGTGTEKPEVRYSVEAIGPEAGLLSDPFNQLMTMDLVSQLQVSLPHTDWTWFDAFHNAFQTPSPQPLMEKLSTIINADSALRSSPSSIFLAVEHCRSKPPVPKAYFVPSVSALTTSDSTLAVVTKALAVLPTHSSDLRKSFPAYLYLVDFLAHHPLGKQLTLIFVAIDCVPLPQESRLKIYLRSSATDFASAVQILRIGNPTSTPSPPLCNLPSSHQLQRLKSLFDALLPLTASPSHFSPSSASSAHHSNESLSSQNKSSEGQPDSGHETAGLLYYFDCAPSQSIPRPKIYLPVKHYAASDESAWRALREWLRKERGAKYLAEWGTRFEHLIGRMGVSCGGDEEAWSESSDRKGQGREGESARRVQTYVSVGFEENGELNVTSYLGPGVYARRA